MIELRPYQNEACDAFLEYIKDNKRGIVVFPTGCGKTIFGLSLAKKIGGRTLWIAHREELISQPKKALRQVWPDVKPGVMKAERNEWARDFVFASVQTAWRPERREKLTGFDLVVVDECHHAAAKSYRLVLEAAGCFEKNGPPLLGLTATPERTDNAALDEIFEDIVYQFQLRQAVESGYLVNVEMVDHPISLDLDKVGMSGGDFKENELDLALLEANIVGEVCAAVNKLARHKKAIIFTVSVKQSQLIAATLREQGYAATYVSGETDPHLRKQRLAGLGSGKYTHIANCMVLCLDEETEILTDQGWAGIDEMSPQHRVANWDNHDVFFEHPHEIVRRPRGRDESMFVLETKSQSIRVTGRHRMIHRATGAAAWRKSPVDDIVGKAHELPTFGMAEPEIMEPVQLPAPTQHEYERLISANSYNLRKNDSSLSLVGSKQEAKARLDRRLALRRKRPDELTLDECRFIGFWIGDGSKAELSSGGVEYSASQSMAYPFIIKWFDSLISRLGFDFARRQRDWGVNHVRWGFGRGTGGGSQARLGLFEIEPYLVKSGSPLFSGLSSSQLLALLDGFWRADGNHGQAKGDRPERFQISNCSKALLDQLQALAVVRGLSASVTKAKKPAKPNHHQVWNLYIQPGRIHQMSTAKERYTIQKEPEPWKPERVWCVKTTTKNIITRRNGRVTVMGNTEGFDEPTVDCIIMARPTTSKSLYIQCVGRGLRIAPGKEQCLIVDMVGVSNRHTLIQAPAIFGLEKEIDDTKMTRDPSSEEPCVRHAQSLLLTQVKGVAPLARSSLRWVKAKDDTYALNCGQGGTILMRKFEDGYLVEVINRSDSGGAREPLTMEPVTLELAQGISEDYVRRASAVYLSNKSARWRDSPASEKQLQALRKWKVQFSTGITKGEASDLLTAVSASNWRNDPATAKQMRALRYRGIPFDEVTLTKGEAGRLLSK